MRQCRGLEYAPRLIDTNLADDIGDVSAAPITRRCETRCHVIKRRAGIGIDRGGGCQAARLFKAERGRYTVAELSGIGDLIDAAVDIFATDQIGGVVARKARPRRGELRYRLTHGEASELDESVIDADISARTRGCVRRPVVP